MPLIYGANVLGLGLVSEYSTNPQVYPHCV